MSAVVQSITSRDNELVQRVRRLLSRPGGYRAAGQVWLEGDHLCQAWLDQGRAALHAVIEQSAWDSRPDLRDLALRAARVAVVPLGLMKAMSGLETPGPLGMLVALRPSEAESNAESTAPDPVEPGVAVGIPTVVLDRLQDPGNAGSILRSVAALGIRQVLALEGTVALWSPKVLRAAMGAHFGLHIIEGLDVPALAPIAGQLVVTDSHEAQMLHEVVLPDEVAWVFGHEGAGVATALRALAPVRVRIPQPGGQESLNVAAAAAICLYEVARRQACTSSG